MKTEILSQEKNVTTVKAMFDANEVNKAIDKTYSEISTKANIKGFRKGHIPRKTVEMLFGKKGVYAETMERIVPDAVNSMVEEYEMNLISDPKIKPGEMEEGKPFEVTVTCELSPEVTLPDIETIEAKKTIYKASEKLRDENIKSILEASTKMVPTYEERPLTDKDCVSVKFTSYVIDTDGTSKEVEKDQKTEFDLAMPNMRQEIVKALVGKKPGDKASIEIEVEKELQNKDIAGKKMRYDVEVQGIMKNEAPELTDATVAEISHGKQKTVDELKAEITRQLEKSAEEESAESLRNSAVEAITAQSQVDIPETLIIRERAAIRADQEQRIKQQSGLDFDEFIKQNKMDKKKYEKDLNDAATAVVKRSLVLEAIADANDIEWTPEELEAELQKIAATTHVELKKLKDYVYGDRSRLYEIADRIRGRKTVDLIVTKVKVKEVEPPQAAPAKADDAEKPADDAKPAAEDKKEA